MGANTCPGNAEVCRAETSGKSCYSNLNVGLPSTITSGSLLTGSVNSSGNIYNSYSQSTAMPIPPPYPWADLQNLGIKKE